MGEGGSGIGGVLLVVSSSCGASRCVGTNRAEGRLCLWELVLPEARLFFGDHAWDLVVPGLVVCTFEGSRFGSRFTADPGRARALDDWFF